MNRREAVSLVSLLLGGTLIGADAFISGCSPAVQKKDGLFSSDDLSLLDDVGDTIIPETAGSPGAKSVKIGQFMKKIVTDCYELKDQEIFTEGIGKLNSASNKKYNRNFSALAANEKQSLLEGLDKEAKDYEKTRKKNDSRHYFTMMKQLTVWGYFSSEAGATKALRYVAIPGRYDGIINYKKGDKAWAT